MGRRGVAMVLAVLVVTSGCSELFEDPTVPEDAAPPGVEPGESIREVVDGWEDERRANAPVGLAASLTVQGQYRLRADGASMTAPELRAPFTLAPAETFSTDGRFVLFENATVAGAGEGTLLVRGAAIEATDGAVRDLPVARATGGGAVRLRPGTDDDPPAPPEHGNETVEDLTFFGERTPAAAADVRLTNYSEAVLFVGNESRPLSGPLTVSAAATWWDAGSVVRTDRVQLETARFAVVAPNASTTVRTDSRTVEDANAVFGQNATPDLEPGRVRAESFRVRQALTDDGPVIDARVEVLPERVDVPVAAGERTWVEVHYREASYEGDAVLRNVSVTGPGAEYVEVPLERPRPYLVRALRDLANSSAPVPLKAAGIIALAPAAALEIVVRGLATAVDCIVAGCPSQHPLPTWIYAGEVDQFYYRVNATGATPGTYDATIHVEGENYETVEIPVRVNVTAAETRTAERVAGPPA